MLTNEEYKSYVGQYAKRFYTPFIKTHIFKITGFRINEHHIPEYLCDDGEGEHWYDCEDSCVITNEMPVRDLSWVANVNEREYAGYDPFTGKLIISNVLN